MTKLRAFIKRFLTRKIIISLAMSYIVMAIVPFFSLIYTYTKTAKMLEEKIYENTAVTMNNALVAIEQRFSSYVSLASAIENSNTLSALLRRNAVTDKPLYDLVEGYELLQTLNNGNEADMIYCYFPKLDYCITDQGAMTSKQLYTRYYTDRENFNYNAWLDSLGRFGYARYAITSDPQGEQYIDFLYTSPLGRTTAQMQYACVIRLSYQRLESIIGNYLSIDDKNFYILDKNDQVIFQKVTYPSAEMPRYADTRQAISPQGRNLQISEGFSVNSWVLVATIPKSVTNGELTYLRLVILLVMLLCLVASAVLVWFFTNTHYKPFDKLLRFAGGGEGGGRKNEYELLDEALSYFQKQKRNMNQIQNSYELLERERFLSSLLMGNTAQYAPIEEALAKYGIRLQSDAFSVVIFYIQNADLLFSEDESMQDLGNYERMDTVKFIIRNVFEETMSALHSAWVFECSGLICAIINVSSSSAATYKADVAKALQQTKGFVEENFHFSFATGMSKLYNGLASLNMAFDEATRAFKFRSLIKAGPDLPYSEILSGGAVGAPGDETEGQLLDYIQLGNYEFAKKAIDEMLQPAIGEDDLDGLESLVFKITCTAIAALSRLDNPAGIRDHEPLFRSMSAIFGSSFQGSDCYDQLCSLVKEVCGICARSYGAGAGGSGRRSSIQANIISNIKAYVEENYSDPNLNVAAVGLYFDITPYYLSTLFKKSEGLSILEYITKTRIEASVQLLREDITVAKISGKVGFNNPHTYIRQFTKYMGCSPNQYRQALDKGMEPPPPQSLKDPGQADQ